MTRQARSPWAHYLGILETKIIEGTQRTVAWELWGTRQVKQLHRHAPELTVASPCGLITEAMVRAGRAGKRKAHLWLPDMGRVGQHIVWSLLANGWPMSMDGKHVMDGRSVGECLVWWRCWSGRAGNVLALAVHRGGSEVMITGLDTAGIADAPPIGDVDAARSRAQIVTGVVRRGWSTMTVSSWTARRLRQVGADETMYPSIAPDLYTWLREAYRPGLCMARHGRWRTCTAFDVSSAYPYIMRDHMLPCGEPVAEGEGTEPPQGRFWVADVTLNYAHWRNGDLPPIVHELGDYALWDSGHWDGEASTIRVSSIEWRTICRTHMVDVLAWGHWVAWREARMPQGVQDWLEAQYDVKQAESGGAYGAGRKTALNAAQGMFARPPLGMTCVPAVDPIGQVEWHDAPLPPEARRRASFLPLSIAVVALQRDRLVSRMQALHAYYGDSRPIVYADTDSIVISGEYLPRRMMLGDGPRAGMGSWQVAGRYAEVRVWGPKMWAGLRGGDRPAVDGHVAGVPASTWYGVEGLSDPDIGDLRWCQEYRRRKPAGQECGYEDMRFDPRGTGAILTVTGREGSVLERL